MKHCLLAMMSGKQVCMPSGIKTGDQWRVWNKNVVWVHT